MLKAADLRLGENRPGRKVVAREWREQTAHRFGSKRNCTSVVPAEKGVSDRLSLTRALAAASIAQLSRRTCAGVTTRTAATFASSICTSTITVPESAEWRALMLYRGWGTSTNRLPPGGCCEGLGVRPADVPASVA